jgi:hypothetical protein
VPGNASAISAVSSITFCPGKRLRWSSHAISALPNALTTAATEANVRLLSSDGHARPVSSSDPFANEKPNAPAKCFIVGWKSRPQVSTKAAQMALRYRPAVNNNQGRATSTATRRQPAGSNAGAALPRASAPR